MPRNPFDVSDDEEKRRRRPGGRAGRAAVTSEPSPESILLKTDVDALRARWSAVNSGYLKDPYVQWFADPSWPRCQPLMDKGTWARTLGIDECLLEFLMKEADSPFPVQIVSLGAGTDTRYFRFRAEGHTQHVRYIELDLPPNVRAKMATLQRPEAFAHLFGTSGSHNTSPAVSDTSFSYENYQLYAMDVQKLPEASAIGLDPGAPTIFLSECCMCYLPLEGADALMQWSARTFSRVGWIVYEPINGNDTFGRMMVDNLARMRGIHMPTLQRYATVQAQHDRLAHLGLGHVSVATIREISERNESKLKGVMPLDEVEEWHMLADHYIVSYGR